MIRMMRGSKKEKTVGKSKPSQASLVSRGLAAKPSLTRCDNGEASGPPSVRSGYSLYSSDSENTAMEVNQGLNRCAKLLANILDTNDQGHPTKTGLATYRHQGQKSKSNAKPRRGHPSKPDPKPVKTGQKNPVLDRKSARASQTKAHHAKNSKKRNAVTLTASTLPEAKQGRREVSGSKHLTVHVIPTGTDDLEDKPVAGPTTAYEAQSEMRNTRHPTAPGFQDHLMSSTPAERESPKKTKSSSPRPRLSPSTLAKPQLRPADRSVLSRRDHNATDFGSKSTGSGSSSREGNAPVGKTGLVRDVALESKQKPQLDTDWMRWYEESVSNQITYESLAGGTKSSSPGEPESRLKESRVKPEKDAHHNFSGKVAPARHPIKSVPQPVKDSEDLLRELVQQLTLLNQRDKLSVPLGKTEQILQGLIQNRQHVPSEDAREETGELNNLPSAADTAGGHYRNQPSLRMEREQPSLGQLLSEFRQTPTRQTPRGIQQDDTPISTSVAPPFAGHEALENSNVSLLTRPPPTTLDSQPTRDTHNSLTVPDHLSSPPQATFFTPKKTPRADHFEDELSNHVSTPFVHQDSHKLPAPDQGKYAQVGKLDTQIPTSPPHASEPLALDSRGQALKKSSLQQIRTLKYLLGELQDLLADHEDIEVSRLLNELEEVCNTLPYTTQKQLLDLNTEVLLAVQPLQSENGQLRRRLRIANHQLQSRELAEKKDEGSLSLEAMALQALNSNLQKQLRQERQEKEQLVQTNLEMSKSLQEKEQQHQNMLRILNEKDSNLLKSRQETLAELQDLRETRSALQSKVDYLELQVEGAGKETCILQLSLEQRDNEIARLKSFNQSLQDQISKLREPCSEETTPPKTLGGIGLQRMSRLLMERSPNKENIPKSGYHSSSASRKHAHPARKLHESSHSNSVSRPHANTLQNPLTKSPKQRVTFLETRSHRDHDIGEWARTDSLWKDQQEQPADLINFEAEAIEPSPEHDAFRSHIPASQSEKRGSGTNLISGSLDQDVTLAENRFSDKVTLENRMSPFHADLDIPEPAFGRDSSPVSEVNQAVPKPSAGRNSYRGTWDMASKSAIGSVVSDSTVSSITTEYEAQFQSGLRDLDAEIGKLQASLKYGTFK